MKYGAWRTLASKERAQAKLDSDFVTEVVDRIDRALDYYETNASCFTWRTTGLSLSSIQALACQIGKPLIAWNLLQSVTRP